MSTSAISPLRPAPRFVGPGHENYDHARQAWNLAADQRPAGVIAAATVAQVQSAVAFARDEGLRIAPQGTGHLGTALPDLAGTLLLKTALHDEVVVDPVARRARVKAGALWEDVVTAAAPHGLAALHGSSPDVGVFGYVLGGGLSFYARRYGLAANHVTALEVVTADGVLRRVDADHEPDLFWAIRGGGGNFGVVTALELELFPLTEVFGGATFWPVADAAAALRAWHEWTRTAPDSVTTSFRILCLPPIPEVPEPLRGVPVAAVDGVALDREDGEELARILRAAAPPMIDGWGPMPVPAVTRLHGDPEDPTPACSRTALLDELDDAALDTFVALCGEGSGSPLLAAEIRQLGGALASPPPGAGATGHLEGAFLLFGVGVPMTEPMGVAILTHADSLVEAMAPWANGRTYLNFAEDGGDAAPSFDAETYARLARVRAQYDPDELWVGSHRIAPAR